MRRKVFEKYDAESGQRQASQEELVKSVREAIHDRFQKEGSTKPG
jgi:hypothetical protein